MTNPAAKTDDKLRLLAEDAEDLAVISAHCQDAVVPLNDMAYLSADRRFLLVASRFRWELPQPMHAADAETESHSRIHAVLRIDHVRQVQLRGLDLKERHRVLELLSIRSTPDGVQLDFAGDAAIRVSVDRLQMALEDYGDPWPTSHRPAHPAATLDPDDAA